MASRSLLFEISHSLTNKQTKTQTDRTNYITSLSEISMPTGIKSETSDSWDWIQAELNGAYHPQYYFHSLLKIPVQGLGSRLECTVSLIMASNR